MKKLFFSIMFIVAFISLCFSNDDDIDTTKFKMSDGTYNFKTVENKELNFVVKDTLLKIVVENIVIYDLILKAGNTYVYGHSDGGYNTEIIAVYFYNYGCVVELEFIVNKIFEQSYKKVMMFNSKCENY